MPIPFFSSSFARELSEIQQASGAAQTLAFKSILVNGSAPQPHVELARMQRDLVTLLCTDRVSTHIKLEIFDLIRKKYALSNETLQAVVSHAYEVAMLKGDIALIRAIKGLSALGIHAEVAFNASPERLGRRDDKNVFGISSNIAVKVGSQEDIYWGSESYSKERRFGKTLFEQGVSVPRPINVNPAFAILKRFKSLLPESLMKAMKCTDGMPLSFTAFMERIEGETCLRTSEINQLETSGGRREEMERQFGNELEGTRQNNPEWQKVVRVEEMRAKAYRQAADLGLAPSDTQSHNSIFSTKLDQLFLIDFAWWNKISRFSFSTIFKRRN